MLFSTLIVKGNELADNRTITSAMLLIKLVVHAKTVAHTYDLGFA